MKLKELATRIREHLQRFEADPEINKPKTTGRSNTALSPYWHASCGVAGRYVSVCYVGYQGISNLTREEAEGYIEMLDKGFVGRHWEALRLRAAALAPKPPETSKDAASTSSNTPQPATTAVEPDKHNVETP